MHISTHIKINSVLQPNTSVYELTMVFTASPSISIIEFLCLFVSWWLDYIFKLFFSRKVYGLYIS